MPSLVKLKVERGVSSSRKTTKIRKKKASLTAIVGKILTTPFRIVNRNAKPMPIVLVKIRALVTLVNVHQIRRKKEKSIVEKTLMMPLNVQTNVIQIQTVQMESLVSVE